MSCGEPVTTSDAGSVLDATVRLDALADGDAGFGAAEGGAATGLNEAGSSLLAFCLGVCADLSSDPSNCGACGNACGIGACVAGQCTEEGGCEGGECEAAPADSGCVRAASCGCVPGGGTCTVAPACGCGGGTKCARDDGAPESCVTSGDVPIGEPCQASTDCAGAGVCFANHCRLPCVDAGCSSGEACTPVYVAGVDQGFSVCVAPCNPLSPSTAEPGAFAACDRDERCVLVGNGTNASYCATATGAQPAGADCRTSADCLPDEDCAIFAGNGLGTCLALCAFESSSDACPSNQACIPFGVTVAGADLGDCETPCNLLEPGEPSYEDETACTPQQNCLFFAVTEGTTTGCFVITATLERGDACDDSSQCPQGTTCVVGENTGESQCLGWCILGDSCPDGGACTAFESEVEANGQDYGYCEP
jgi:hypothetical protein